MKYRCSVSPFGHIAPKKRGSSDTLKAGRWRRCWDVQDTEGLSYQPPIPGFPSDSNLEMFFWCSEFRHDVGTMHLNLRLVRAFSESGRISLVFHPQKLVIIFRLVVCHFSTEFYSSTWRSGAAVVEVCRNSQDTT